MPDRPPHRPARRIAGAALLTSVLLHAGLLAFLVRLPDNDKHRAVPEQPTIELVVIMPDDAEKEKSREKDVVLSEPVVSAPAVDRPVSPIAAVAAPAPVSTPVVSRTTAPQSGGDGAGFFRSAANGRTVVYVLDRSMSMGERDGLRQMRTELLASLGRLPPTVLFQIIPYNQIAEPLAVRSRDGMLAPDADTLAEVERLISQLRATGGTDHRQALLRGLEFRPDVLYFATDGDGLTVEQAAFVSRCNAGRTSIHVVDFSDRPKDPNNPLQQLALQNRGTYRRVIVKELVRLDGP